MIAVTATCTSVENIAVTWHSQQEKDAFENKQQMEYAVAQTKLKLDDREWWLKNSYELVWWTYMNS